MHVIIIHQRHRRTDRQTTRDRNTTLCTKVHRAVKTDIPTSLTDTRPTAQWVYNDVVNVNVQFLLIDSQGLELNTTLQFLRSYRFSNRIDLSFKRLNTTIGTLLFSSYYTGSDVVHVFVIDVNKYYNINIVWYVVWKFVVCLLCIYLPDDVRTGIFVTACVSTMVTILFGLFLPRDAL